MISFLPVEKSMYVVRKRIVQDLNDPLSYNIHAFLHRQEGDHSNASYWYHRAGVRVPDISLDREWEEIVSNLAISK